MFEKEPHALLVTLTGECILVEFRGIERRPAWDTLHSFYIADKSRSNRVKRVLVNVAGPVQRLGVSDSDYDRRIETVLSNRIRRAFDSGELSFDVSNPATFDQEIDVDRSDFEPQPAVSDGEVRQFILHTAYWLSYKFGGTRPIEIASRRDLEYLGVKEDAIFRNLWFLEQEQVLEDLKMDGFTRPTSKLVKLYEARHATISEQESVLPAGTQYEAFKAVKNILNGASRKIFIADNYLDESVLDMLSDVRSQPSIELLTAKASADFKTALAKFQGQYGRKVDARRHRRQVHDRAIVIDDTDYYALGASIKDLGDKLTFVNRLQDPAAIARLRSAIQSYWSAAQPL